MTAQLATVIANDVAPIGLLNQLLADQQDLTAVERFSSWHDDGDKLQHQVPSSSASYTALIPLTRPLPGEQLAFEVDLDSCSGCKSCVVACHNLNGLLEEETWRRVGMLVGSSAGLPIVQHVTTACHHCVEPGCLAGCPVMAYVKEPLTGIVRHLDDQCIGCKYCTMMCPYDVPQYSSTLGIVRKCDMCAQRLAGWEAPACVQACPNEAIRIRTVKKVDCYGPDWNTEVVSCAPASSLTRPTTRYVSTNPARDLVQPVDLLVDHAHEKHLPLALMLVLSQASVGLWCWIAFAGAVQVRDPQAVAFSCLTASIIGFIGIHLAMLHLGRPWLAFRAWLGWRTSWLSREAIAFGAFMASMCIATVSACAAAQWFDWLVVKSALSTVSLQTIAQRILPWSIAVTSGIGLAGVFCSIEIYVATRRELWSITYTSSQFLGSVVGLGLSLGCSISTSYSAFPHPSLGAMLTMLGVLVASIGSWPLIQCYFAGANQQIEWCDLVARSGRVMRMDLRYEWILCAILHGISLSTASLSFATGSSWLLIASTIALVSGQILARILYFASVVTHRMPGGNV